MKFKVSVWVFTIITNIHTSHSPPENISETRQYRQVSGNVHMQQLLTIKTTIVRLKHFSELMCDGKQGEETTVTIECLP